MAGKKISELNKIYQNELQADDVLLVVQNEPVGSKKLPVSEMDARYKTPAENTQSQLSSYISSNNNVVSGINLRIDGAEDRLDGLDDEVSDLKSRTSDIEEDVSLAKADILTLFQSLIPTGSILPYGGASSPIGFLLCNGDAVSRTEYANLFAAIGTAFGAGDGSTTFNIPDLRGMFLRGVDGGAGRDPDWATRTAMGSGGNTGDAVGSVQDDAFEGHLHMLVNSGTANNGVLGSNAHIGRQWNNRGYTDRDDYRLGGQTNAPDVGRSSTVGGSETRPVNAYVNYIIKT